MQTSNEAVKTKKWQKLSKPCLDFDNHTVSRLFFHFIASQGNNIQTIYLIR